MNSKKYALKLIIRTDRINSKGQSPIYARIITDKKLEISTSMYASKEDWNPQTQRLNMDAKDAGTTNAFLDSFCSKVLDLFTKMFMNGEVINAEILRERLFGKVEKVISLMELVTEFNTNMESKVGKVSNSISPGSYKNYKTTKKFLEEFIYWKYKKRDMLMAEVKYAFCEHYCHFLTTVKTCNNNGAAKHIQRLKTIINYGVKMDYLKSNTISSYTLKYQPFYQIKLTWDEIQQLRDLDISHQTMREVLHVFLFQCFTGIAYADAKSITPNNLSLGVDGHLWLMMERAKTGIRFTLPILNPLKEILALYLNPNSPRDKPFLPMISNQKMNDYLKIISELAKIHKPLSTHIARHTFATTVTLQMGVPIETVSKMLGHSKLATTQMYSVVTEIKISKEMEKLRLLK
jgi:site-specific recombinase XerD